MKTSTYQLFTFLLFFTFGVSAQDPSSTRSIPLQTTTYPLKPPGDTTPYPLLPDGEVRNVILFIGDGMGINQVVGSRLRIYGPKGLLHIERMPVTGLLTTESEDTLVTGSAAAASALATGFKVPFNAISVSKEGRKLVTIMQRAHEMGLGTGLITTTEITDATPAAFGAHVPHRRDHDSIARQLVESGFDVLLGCGKKRFVMQDESGNELNLTARIKALGYDYFENVEGMRSARGMRLFGLFDTELMKSEKPEPTLAEMTTKALDVLNRNTEGFLVMIESERIDEETHDNRFESLATSMLAFDEAVKVALDFALKDRRTLVIVTADHETGGLQIDKGGPITGVMHVAWNTKGHTGQPVPLYAFGPHAIKFTGTKQNTDVPKLIASLLRLSDFPKMLD